jgi:hypothetical protein
MVGVTVAGLRSGDANRLDDVCLRSQAERVPRGLHFGGVAAGATVAALFVDRDPGSSELRCPVRDHGQPRRHRIRRISKPRQAHLPARLTGRLLADKHALVRAACQLHQVQPPRRLFRLRGCKWIRAGVGSYVSSNGIWEWAPPLTAGAIPEGVGTAPAAAPPSIRQLNEPPAAGDVRNP